MTANAQRNIISRETSIRVSNVCPMHKPSTIFRTKTNHATMLTYKWFSLLSYNPIMHSNLTSTSLFPFMVKFASIPCRFSTFYPSWFSNLGFPATGPGAESIFPVRIPEKTLFTDFTNRVFGSFHVIMIAYSDMFYTARHA